MDNRQVAIIAGVAAAAVGTVLIVKAASGKDPQSIINQLILDGDIPANYTAKAWELTVLVGLGYDTNSAVYKQFIDSAYQKALARAELIGGYVAYSSELGYYATTAFYYE